MKNPVITKKHGKTASHCQTFETTIAKKDNHTMFDVNLVDDRISESSGV